jgi:hypothetical protein
LKRLLRTARTTKKQRAIDLSAGRLDSDCSTASTQAVADSQTIRLSSLGKYIAEGLALEAGERSRTEHGRQAARINREPKNGNLESRPASY